MRMPIAKIAITDTIVITMWRVGPFVFETIDGNLCEPTKLNRREQEMPLRELAEYIYDGFVTMT